MEILLEDEGGRELAKVRGNADLIVPLLPGAHDSGYECLRFIDPYGNTVFNRLQIPILEDEIRTIRGRAKNDEVRSLLDEVAALCEQGRRTPHVYLKFIGD